MDGSAVRFWLVEDVAGAPSAGGPPERRRLPGPNIPVLRLLEDPAARAQLGLTLEQETRIFTLMEKAKSLRERLRENAAPRFAGERRKAAGPDRLALKQERDKALEEAMQAARPDFEAIANEAEAVLTADQAAKLRMIGRENIRRQMATGGLSALLSAPARERLGLSDEQVEKIGNILKDLEPPPLKGRKAAAGEAAAGPSEETLKQHAELVKSARARIMEVLTPEQREKAAQVLAGVRPPREGLPGKKRPPQAPTKGYQETV
jgi:Spy/CpxP family protein refolding chaperone